MTLRHIKNAVVENFHLIAVNEDLRKAVIVNDVKNANFSKVFYEKKCNCNQLIMAKTLLLIVFLSTAMLSNAQTQAIWPEGQMPNFSGTIGTEQLPERDIVFIENVQVPGIESFIPTKQAANGAAVLICPGGGYAGVAYDWEGSDVAKWLNSLGVAAFVLKYRMPQAESVEVSHLAPLQDAQRGIRWIRRHAKQFNIDENKVGVMGFSAGGHLASTLGTRYNTSSYATIDEMDEISARPDFMMLLYPVISMKKGVTHNGSRNNLLGKKPSKELIEEYSNELNVKADTPPTFLLHSGDDGAVPVENSIRFYQALIKNKVKATMHIYPTGGHGYSLGYCRDDAPNWAPLAEEWIMKVIK
ncbi:alpha/beta hydrolase [Carboxylicivirga marina]|uniref:Alpha/beta hydrolase n=1 Tax=Carboxylicivirga marina TaxID=2800988 RepID=A0ABS1HQ18_9BACT|nr:alpha/beta hydrolase [Carboxylicivirga marina]MBK3519585.1 alpha/beta hydrolase [Carboxylicivirga marina]